MHAACLTGNTEVLSRLVEAGGDLRLHDRDGKTPQDWAMRQSDIKRRRRALSFIDWAREKALCDSASATAAASKHVVELSAGLRFPSVLFLFLLLCNFLFRPRNGTPSATNIVLLVVVVLVVIRFSSY